MKKRTKYASLEAKVALFALTVELFVNIVQVIPVVEGALT